MESLCFSPKQIQLNILCRKGEGGQLKQLGTFGDLQSKSVLGLGKAIEPETETMCSVKQQREHMNNLKLPDH